MHVEAVELDLQGFGPQIDSGVEVVGMDTVDHVAQMVGASRSRVTEHLSEFAQKHLISQKDRHLVVDHEKLKGFLKESHREKLSGEFSD